MIIGLLASLPITLDTFFIRWVEAWRREGHEVRLAAGEGPTSSKCAVLPGLSRHPGAGVLKAVVAVHQWVADEKLDILVTNTGTASGVSRLRRQQCPVVYFCHGLHWGPGGGVRRWPWMFAESALVANTEGLICMNGHDSEWLVRRARGRPVLYLQTGVGLELSEWPLLIAPPLSEPLRLLWIGEFAPRKRPLDAVHAMAALRAASVQVELTMLGAGSEMSAARSAADRLGVVDQLVTPGFGDPIAHLARAHAVVHTAEWEGLCRALLEATGVGRATFGYDTKGVREIPGISARRKIGDSSGLAEDLAAWWTDCWCRGAVASPAHSYRDMLDWRIPYRRVTDFLEAVATRSCSSA